MDFRDSPEEADFRGQFRSWLQANLPADWSERDPHVGRWDLDIARAWTRRLHGAGYAGLSWPTEYGGRGPPPPPPGVFLGGGGRGGAPGPHGGVGARLG